MDSPPGTRFSPRGQMFATFAPILPDSGVESPTGLGRLAAAAAKADNLPYTILGTLAFLSLAARVILLLR
jgi:hypothetical protein